jgi:hypothetical protein
MGTGWGEGIFVFNENILKGGGAGERGLAMGAMEVPITEGEGFKWREPGGLKGGRCAHNEGTLRLGNVFMVFGGIGVNTGAVRGSVEGGVTRG